jgi:hypothetical protein
MGHLRASQVQLHPGRRPSSPPPPQRAASVAAWRRRATSDFVCCLRDSLPCCCWCSWRFLLGARRRRVRRLCPCLVVALLPSLSPLTGTTSTPPFSPHPASRLVALAPPRQFTFLRRGEAGLRDSPLSLFNFSNGFSRVGGAHISAPRTPAQHTRATHKPTRCSSRSYIVHRQRLMTCRRYC